MVVVSILSASFIRLAAPSSMESVPSQLDFDELSAIPQVKDRITLKAQFCRGSGTIAIEGVCVYAEVSVRTYFQTT